MKEQGIQKNKHKLTFLPESLAGYHHILEYEDKRITILAKNYAFWPASKRFAFTIKKLHDHDENRVKYVYYSQEAIAFEDKLCKSIFLRTRQLPSEKKSDYVLWATATAIHKMHSDDSINNNIFDESFTQSRKSLSRKLIFNARKAIFIVDKKALSYEWASNIGMELFNHPYLKELRIQRVSEILDEFVNNPVYSLNDIGTLDKI